MSVAGSGNILSRGSILNSQDGFGNHFTSIRANDLDTDDLISSLFSKDLNESIVVVVCSGSAVRNKRENSFFVLDF